MNRIKELRKENKVKLKDLTEFLGVSFQTIYRWEDGGSVKTVYAEKIAELFGVDVSYLMGVSDNRLTEKEDEKQLTKRQQYIQKLTNINISLLREPEKMSAQDLSDIKKVARSLYEDLVWMQFEAEEREGK